ncbi:MAG: aminotransferase class V-fold PLP-dependent enzyme [Actinomycetia bacterium]|nr:aminotransferase class V-fold PLP-dependent enzyme [Actinomycetes bacterium]
MPPTIDIEELFPAPGDAVYLNTASMALGNQRGVDAMKTALDEWSRGRFDWVNAEHVGEEVRSLVAALIGADAQDMALVTGAGGGASTVAAQLPRIDDTRANIVVPARDFASNFLPWMLLQDLGYELRTVEDIDGVLPIDAFTEAVDKHTVVLATSLVQSATGYRVDLDALKQLVAGRNAWLVVDASQAFGAVAFDVTGIDALFSCSHKWSLGMRGLGHLYVSPALRDSFDPITPGWKATEAPMSGFYGPVMALSATASKLDASSPWFNPIVDIEGLRIVDSVGIDVIEAYNLGLIDELESRGIAIPFERSRRSSIVSIDVSDTNATLKAFDADNIIASVRAGKVRVSLHLYNTIDDVDRLVAAIS